MGFLKLFAGKGPDEYERRGDRLFETGEYGAAKLEYETALDKAVKGPGDADLEERLREKIGKSREALALQHRENAERLRESGDFEGASELVELALELTQDPELAAGLKRLLNTARDDMPENGEDVFVPHSPRYREEEDAGDVTEEEYFTALCGLLDDEVQEAYHGYGEAFMRGYVALNRGEYDRAAAMLSQAMEENYPDSMIPLELATACLNLERYEEALALAERFLEDHPGSVHGYHALCETLWAAGRFDEARERLSSCPAAIAETPPILHLRGESLLRSGRYREAEALYRELLGSHGRDERTVVSLATACEALGRTDEALDLYGEIMTQCRGCGARINPFVKRKYADISVERENYSTQILELYLSLIEEDPEGREHHFRKAGQIYAAMGNEREARRYRSFADRLGGSPTE